MYDVFEASLKKMMVVVVEVGVEGEEGKRRRQSIAEVVWWM